MKAGVYTALHLAAAKIMQTCGPLDGGVKDEDGGHNAAMETYFISSELLGVCVRVPSLIFDVFLFCSLSNLVLISVYSQ